ncbi:CAZyme family GH18 [Penicillium citrinum]|uniref:chitinase n=1 Tax=Penicillium citrinum TaxID=5077 RepID=A0A9W9TQY8_PENCI|nr:CAZyme family GH18 [Penicillium citrinum]KAJ5233829.1 CAZyme family GH18 [Penicillium citrinum]
MLKNLALGLLAAQGVAATRFAMYIDEWHKTDLPGTEQTQGMDYAIMGFAKTTTFNSGSSYTPFEPVDTMRKRFGPDTKLMVAIGGWGDSEGFSTGAKDDASRKTYAKNVAAMLEANNFDGVDIDWEYPGGNGDDYKRTPNKDKVDEIETYPKFLAAIREAIGNKTLSIAVPGRLQDMIAFTKEQGPKIFEHVDMINVMSYDLMNRRDNVTFHASDVAGSLETINAYLDIGADPAKMNLGFAYYAKWFETDPNSDCDEHPLGCATVKLENADGTDTGKSGAVTFTEKVEAPSNALESWKRAEKNGMTDEKKGGQYYWDKESNMFWTWDTPEIISRKFTEIVDEKKLGGVMAWSLGEDTLKFAHVDAMQKGVKQSTQKEADRKKVEEKKKEAEKHN